MRFCMERFPQSLSNTAEKPLIHTNQCDDKHQHFYEIFKLAVLQSKRRKLQNCNKTIALEIYLHLINVRMALFSIIHSVN